MNYETCPGCGQHDAVIQKPGEEAFCSACSWAESPWTRFTVDVENMAKTYGGGYAIEDKEEGGMQVRIDIPESVRSQLMDKPKSQARHVDVILTSMQNTLSHYEDGILTFDELKRFLVGWTLWLAAAEGPDSVVTEQEKDEIVLWTPTNRRDDNAPRLTTIGELKKVHDNLIQATKHLSQPTVFFEAFAALRRIMFPDDYEEQDPN